MFGNSDGNFSVFFLGTHRKTVESRLHRDLHLAGAGYSGLDRAARTLILDRNLLARSAISHCLAGHAYADRTRLGGDDDLIPLADNLGHLQLIGCDHLIGLHGAGKLVAQGLVHSGQIALIERRHIPLGEADIRLAQHGVA